MATKPLSLSSTQGVSGWKSFEVEKQPDEDGSNLHPSFQGSQKVEAPSAWLVLSSSSAAGGCSTSPRIH